MRRIETQIDRVTVYKNGALVERTGRAGPGSFEIEGLPLLLSWSSLRLRPSLGEIRHVAERTKVEFEDGPSTDADTSKLARLTVQTHVFKERAKAYDSLAGALSLAAEPVGSLKDVPRTLERMPHWANIPKWIEQEALRLSEAHVRAHAKWQEVCREYERERKRSQRVDAPARASRGVAFDLAGVPGDVEIPFSLEYFVPAARWLPTYALDLDGERGKLTLYAMVANATGEAWSGARLSFSTVDLARETTLPEVLSWRIGRAQDQRRPAFRPLPSGLDSLFDAYDRGKTRARDEESDAPPPAPPMAPPRSSVQKERIREQPPEAFFGAEGSAPGGPLSQESFDDEILVGGADFAEVSSSTLAAFATEDTDRLEMTAMPRMAMASPPPPSSSAAFDSPPALRGGGGMKKRSKGAPEAVERIHAGGNEPLPPSLRTMSMRLRGPDEPSRGRLVPMDEREHMLSLVAPEEADAVARALSSLERAAQGMLQAPLPHGTELLSDATPPTTFVGETRTSVPDDGEYHRVAVRQMDAEGQAELRVVPRENEDVFRYFLFDLEPGIALPDGPLDVSERGTFRVRSRLTTTGVSRRLQLNLGVEPQVRVLGRVARVHQEEKGLMNSSSVVEHTVELTLRNTMETSVRLRVFDRVPVPDVNEKDIEVALTKSSPPASRTDKGPDSRPLEGGVEWSLVVESGETLKVEHAYQIRLPAKTEIVGGNRRE